MSGTKPAPEFEGWIRLFVDGIKLIVITIVYTIPIMILTLIPLVLYAIPVPAGSEPLLSPEVGIIVALALLVIFTLAAIVVGILATFAMVRFSRTGRMGEAFRVGTLLAHIGEIGWLNVFVALVVLTVVVASSFSSCRRSSSLPTATSPSSMRAPRRRGRIHSFLKLLPRISLPRRARLSVSIPGNYGLPKPLSF